MRRLYLTIFVITQLVQISFAQSPDAIGNMATFCEVWGFLKYHHPNVAAGKADWDKVFVTKITQLDTIKNYASQQLFYINWVNSLGEFKQQEQTLKYDSNVEFKNYTTPLLINDSIRFNKELSLKFNEILNAKRKKHYYVQQNFFHKGTSYKNEKNYKDSIFPAYPTRLLTLARYWNIINYYYPYKYKTDERWDSVLLEMLPKFMYANNISEYNLAILELTAKIDDSHSRFRTDETFNYFGRKYAPFDFLIIDDKAVVTDFYNDSLCRINDMKIGDVFETVNQKTIKEIVEENRKYVAASNEATLLRNMWNIIFNGQEDSVLTTFTRNNIHYSKYIKRYTFDEIGEITHRKQPMYQKYDNNIGYMNLSEISAKDVKNVMKQLFDTRAIILDLRELPKSPITVYRIAKSLGIETRPFVKLVIPIIEKPAVFRYLKAGGFLLQKKNEPPLPLYKGDVVILFNEYTQSSMEFSVMAFETFPNAIKVGGPSAGADGNISFIPLPGGYKAIMSGIGVYYPDGKETQRIGIIPHYLVRPTIQGIQSNRDEVLEKAIEVILQRSKQ